MFDEWGSSGGDGGAAPQADARADRDLAAAPQVTRRRVAGLAQATPGPELVDVLESVDLDDVDDYTLVEVVAAWRRVGAWVAARAAAAAGVLAGRESMNPSWPAGAGGGAGGVAGEELALRLACSRRTASDLVTAGLAFEGALAATGDALERA